MSDLTNHIVNETLTEFKNPFSKKNVTRVTINMHNSKSDIFRQGKCMEATVYFTNGDTSGDQKFYADSLKELLDKISILVETL